jgi:hypothetical protein
MTHWAGDAGRPAANEYNRSLLDGDGLDQVSLKRPRVVRAAVEPPLAIATKDSPRGS